MVIFSTQISPGACFFVSRTDSPFPRPPPPIFPRPVAGRFQEDRRGRASSSQLARRPARVISRKIAGGSEMASPAPWPPRDGSRRPSHLRTRACAGKGAIFSAFFFVGARRFSCAPGPERLVEKVTPRHHRPRLPTASGVRTVMWSSSPFHTRGGAPACSTPPPTTRTATATATTTTNRRCNARLTSVPGLRSVVPHIDEMLHQFCRALSAMLRCSSPPSPRF